MNKLLVSVLMFALCCLSACAVVGERSKVDASGLSLTNESPAVSIVDSQGSIVLAGQRPSHYTKLDGDGQVYSFGAGATSKEVIFPVGDGRMALFRMSDDMTLKAQRVAQGENGIELVGVEVSSTISETTRAAYTAFPYAMQYQMARDEASKAAILASVATLGDAIKAAFTALTGVPVPIVNGGGQ